MSTSSNGTPHVLDLAGIGIGPANLSLAALLQPCCPNTRARFFDMRSEFSWHPGLMLPDATINVSFLKDLVTLADPTSRYSFLCFLHCQRDIYSFINADFDSVSRREFNEYLRWACEQLDSVQFDTEVNEVDFVDDRFLVRTSAGDYPARNVVLGMGLGRYVPECVIPHLGDRVYHAAEHTLRQHDFSGKRVAVVGGGQTGAELVLSLLGDSDQSPKQVIWISRRANFAPLDDSAFANELYTPEYSDHFGQLPFEVRQSLLTEQKMTSDGINMSLLKRIYQRLYEIRYLEKATDRWRLCPARELIELEQGPEGYVLSMRQRHSDAYELEVADYVICCTGFSRAFPRVLEPLRGRIDLEEDEFVVADDYSLRWDGPDDARIYVQNAARAARGVADPNLSLNAWRAARIINSLHGTTVYDVDGSSSMVDWGPVKPEGYRRQIPGGRKAGARTS
ncbi:MAG: SidA/IucD/PvdA family monooxygenase [Planctomycetota bacterium]|nr:SidA/IucD/PvdA family monooxygenase [Planctomycetota bacterium]